MYFTFDFDWYSILILSVKNRGDVFFFFTEQIKSIEHDKSYLLTVP